MSPPKPEQFGEFFHAVYERDPFPWQTRLAKRVCAGEWPHAVALPTAAGKTACIDIAVFALACRAKDAPRRVFFVVDRRIVVDQAKLHADHLAKKLHEAKEADGILKAVADSLRDIAEPGWREWSEQEQKEVRPLDVYSLRGGMYRESAWTRSPLQPTVIASTVDQVGSRLLFRGYGVSDSMKPVHAGLVGNDALILLDEAHCAKPFDQTVQAVKAYRAWNESPAPFRFVSITATPTGELQPEQILRDEKDDREHKVLGDRIKASKPAKLVVAEKAKGKNGRSELVKELEKHARELAKDAACVGIIVNRVATARELAARLGPDAVLLTGRMRPLDRDRLFREKLQPLLSNAEGTPPKFVVGTQCLECGADFDFHALVTECASLDALRQRFGRLNRVAKRDTANAVIVIRADQTEDTTDDPVYGPSLANTWKWLNAKATDGVFDFGVSAVRTTIGEEDITPLNAPAADAPVLFPAHLDCWVQTNPKPTPDPEPALFLHGPKQGGQPDVQVVFRADLGGDSELWADIVSLCPPSSSEAVPVRIGDFKRWLVGEPLSDSGDVEGEADAVAEISEEPTARTALRWRGPANSELVGGADRITPDDVYVVPCSAPDAASLGDFPFGLPADADYAEEAFQRSRDKALLRLLGSTLNEDAEDFDDALDAEIEATATAEAPDWRRAAEHLADRRNRRRREIERHPLGGWVVSGRRRLGQFDPTYLDDGEPAESFRGRAVSLTEHSRGVAAFAERFATGCGLDAALYKQAGLWHDLGKLDPRFQAMLQGRSPRTTAGQPLAKSARSPRTSEERHAAREIHRYPAGARHELLSAALVATKTDDDLLLHLIATHHGSARPFADPVDEDDTVQPAFSASLFGVAFALPDYRQRIAEWNAELPERFWRVVRQHGWWGAAYREAVFRLADHAQSRAEQDRDAEKPRPEDVPPPPFRPPAARRERYALPLTGLDGSNPLAFLAALGTLRLADEKYAGATLRWERNGCWTPILELPVSLTTEEFVACLYGCVHRVQDGSASDAAEALHKSYRQKVKETSKALDSVKARKLRGKERDEAIATEVTPLVLSERNARREWLRALEAAVPAPFLSLGKSIAVSGEEFADFAERTAERLRRDGPSGRSIADFASAFGCEVCVDRNGRVVPTEFQLITGSGHQFFLDTFGALMESVTVEQLRRALFGHWTYPDPRLSFRWDPIDDRRYAVNWEDPSNTEVRTEHGANLLAGFALPFFPTVPTRWGSRTTGFNEYRDGPALRWPLWETPRSSGGARSLFQLAHLHTADANQRLFRTYGVNAVFRVRKFEVGRPPLSKLNLSPAVVV